MIFLQAFLMAGIWCAALQIIFLITKWHPGWILAGGFIFGGFLTAIGVMSKLVAWGGAGMMALVIDGGEAIVNGTMAAMTGQFIPLLMFCGIMMSVILIGFIFGFIMVAKQKKPSIAA